MKLKEPSEEDNKIMRELIHQVQKATPKKGSEVNVMTFISLDMWKAWLRAIGDPEDCQPTEWKLKDGHRVFGSLTVIVPGDGMFSWSQAI